MYIPMTRYKDFELHYLVELTKNSVKPLSRWEKPLTEKQLEWLNSRDLLVASIPRFTIRGDLLTETVFSKSQRYLNVYRKAFTGTILSMSVVSQRLEGFLFGYPSCCVEQFIQKPYIENMLDRQDQEMLFHWACPECRSTAGLLPYYRRIHGETKSRYHYDALPPKTLGTQRMIATAAAMLLATTVAFSSAKGDEAHQLPIPGDDNGNGMSLPEEVTLGSYYTSQDAAYWGPSFASVVNSLPDEEQQEAIYKLDHWTLGSFACPVCGEMINMGFAEIVNPMRNLSVNLDYMALHFMENGSFSWQAPGTPDTQRIDIASLKKVIYPYDADHMISFPGDADEDGLTDSIEEYFHFSSNAWDTDNAGVPDAVHLTERLTALFPKLLTLQDSLHTQVTLNLAYGVEECSICGAVINMGYVEFLNPENGKNYQIPLINLHALAHGSFRADGAEHPNSYVAADTLFRTMNTHQLFIENDRDNDGLTDSAEEMFGSNPDLPDSDFDGIADSKELADRIIQKIESLPTEEQPDQPYITHYEMDGVYNCLMCGEYINMGYFEITNPGMNYPPLRISYHLYHFISHGSFSMIRRTYEGWDGEEVNPVELAQYINLTVAVDDEPVPVPDQIKLLQNYPNPFNAATIIRFALPEETTVILRLYNNRGQLVRQLYNDQSRSGEHSIHWDGKDDAGRDVSSGIYILELTAGNQRASQKLVVTR